MLNQCNQNDNPSLYPPLPRLLPPPPHITLLSSPRPSPCSTLFFVIHPKVHTAQRSGERQGRVDWLVNVINSVMSLPNEFLLAKSKIEKRKSDATSLGIYLQGGYYSYTF